MQHPTAQHEGVREPSLVELLNCKGDYPGLSTYTETNLAPGVPTGFLVLKHAFP